MRQDFNYHTHTWRCGHAGGSDEEYIQYAIKAGFKVLGMSDHRPYRTIPRPGERMDWSLLDDYLSSMKNLKDRYSDQIDIKIGFETEYYPQQEQEIRDLLNRVDYMILGQHYDDQYGTNDYCFYMSEAQIIQYGRQVCDAMDKKLFLYAAHPDYIMYGQHAFTEACAECADMIARKAAETETPLEVNINGITKGLRSYGNTRQYPYPFRQFWQIMAKYPIKCVYGFDSHDPKLLNETFMYDETDRILEGLNLNFIDIRI